MKKIILSVILLLIFSSVASASNLNGSYEGNPIAKIIVNGEEVNVTGTPAYAQDGSVMVPVRVLRELGVGVAWDQATYSVTITPQEPVEVIKEVVKVVDAEGNTVVSPAVSETTTETPIASPEPSQEPAPDNTAACQSIRDSYGSQIALVGYEGGAEGPKRNKILNLQYERDKALANAGC